MKYLLPLIWLLGASCAFAAEPGAPQEVWTIAPQAVTIHQPGEYLPVSVQDESDVLVLDTYSGLGAGTPASTPRTYMGFPFDLDDAAGSNPQITQINFYILHAGTTTQTYQALEIHFRLWDDWSETGNPVFSNALTPPVAIVPVAGPITLVPNAVVTVMVAMPTPVPVSGLGPHGFAVHYEGDTGSGMASTENLTALIRYRGDPIAVGGNPMSVGYGYRDASGRADLNFADSDGMTVNYPNEALAVEMYAIRTIFDQTITDFVTDPAHPVYSDGSFSVSANGGDSGNPVTFSIAPASAGVCASGGTHGSTIQILARGTCTVLADQAGNDDYNPAPQKSLDVQIEFISQKITDFIAVPATPIYQDGSFSVSATGGDSGNPVTFSIDAESVDVCDAGGTNGSTIEILTPGTCIVLADQAGNAEYSAAPQKSLKVKIAAEPGVLVEDGGFEDGFGSDAWAAHSTNFGTPVCIVGCTGGHQPRTGYYWVWFDTAGPLIEHSFMEQRGVLPAGSRWLTFHIYWSSSIDPPEDPGATFEVKLDGNTIFLLTPDNAGDYHDGYTPVSLDISAYADGAIHTLRFEMNGTVASSATDLHLDDISIEAGLAGDTIFADGFE